jgi:gas vesicle protein
MFGFNKKKKEKKQSSLDKVLMGMIVGGAIGSVLGIGLAPKKGSETRKDIGKQADKLLKGAREVVNDATRLMKKPLPTKHVTSKQAPHQFGNKSLPEEK